MPDVPVTRDMIEAAHARIAPHVRRTPVLGVVAGELGLPTGVTLKLELLQHTGSFKARGAFNRILSAAEWDEVPPVGLVAASGGNHGAAVAYAARRLGYPAEIFVPSSSPAMKRDRIASFGAVVHVVDGLYDDAQVAAIEHQSASGALAVHPFEHPHVIAGQGTMSLELGQQLPDGFDTIVVATGGGGFIAGQAAWSRGRHRVVSVEPESSRCLQAALAAGWPTPVPVSGVAADSLGARQIGDVAWAIVEQFVDHAVVVSDDDIRGAQRALWDELRLVVEPGGAAALAALRSGAYVPEPDERVVVVVCGSNADPDSIIR